MAEAVSSSELFPAELLRFENPGLNRPRLNDEENLRSLRLVGAVTVAVGMWETGLTCVLGSLARNSRIVSASGIFSELTEYSRLAALRMPATADLRRMTFSDDDTGDLSSTDVGGVDGVEALELFSNEVLGLDVTLRWWPVALIMSSFESLALGGGLKKPMLRARS
jgi:hypothetical protein